MDNGCIEKTVSTQQLRIFKKNLLAVVWDVNVFLKKDVWPFFILYFLLAKARPHSYCKSVLSLAWDKYGLWCWPLQLCSPSVLETAKTTTCTQRVWHRLPLHCCFWLEFPRDHVSQRRWPKCSQLQRQHKTKLQLFMSSSFRVIVSSRQQRS